MVRYLSRLDVEDKNGDNISMITWTQEMFQVWPEVQTREAYQTKMNYTMNMWTVAKEV